MISQTQSQHDVEQSTLEELESRLWAAANALRGPVDPADFKTYVFPMLFWKWLSDTWAYEHDQAVEKYGDDLDDEIEADEHRFVLPEGASWYDVTTRTAGNLGAHVQQAFTDIEQANPKALARIFGDANWADQDRIPAHAILGIVKAFNQIRLSPDRVSSDLLGQGYEYLLKNFADSSGKKAGEFFTPRSVVHLLVDVLQPTEAETVYDPACGSGGMLVSTIGKLRADGLQYQSLNLYGQEVNLTTSAIARMNLILNGFDSSRIARGDTLRDPKHRTVAGNLRRFDVVIANPPFSLKDWGAENWATDPRAFCGVPPAGNADYAWVQHMVASMKGRTGRAGVVMPLGVLFRGGKEATIRKCIVEADQLEAVIALPTGLFYSTGIPACILIFRSEKLAERQGHVLFVDAAARFVKGKNQNTMSDDDVAAAVAAYRTGIDPDGEDQGVNVRLVPLEEIAGNDFDLNIGRYVRAESAEELDLETALVRYQEARAERITAEEALFARLAAAGIADLGGVQ
ncbi:type I restriction-modification system subunit M [Georgenia muralis]|uniref:site-specific DNA-methyltransferase (adenine-specific) n=1 Tax=Georgenia muralis TaxID=154117 RepID=A0A3N5AAB1_9MICO|nr:class I SAM-dependent DNA methyltransferase [Georgenia muralis]RPF28561.1 type I restriction enzyme M protein [Georgenia muralis]